ncbi:MAG: phytanoyl-CoA dioxygenase family protein [Myxococcota bacterium]|nr:phytanoyl-CoA dioxygenase family protein [Myxococcota bacterium]
MTTLTHLPADTKVEEILATIERDGAVILDGVLSPDEVEATRAELWPYIDATKPGVDSFTGTRTTRTGALIARSPLSRRMVMDPTVVEAARKFLSPWCERIQLHLTQVIRIQPGQKAQAIHRDRWAWGTHLKGLEPQLNTIWALTDFRRENGATRVVPGSIDWADDRRPEEGEICDAEMDAGSVLVYTGSVFHGGGENTSDGDRIGVNLTYTLGWLRQEENQYLSCPPEIAKDLPPELTDLMGYSMGSYALGYYTPPLPPGEGSNLIGPENALGRTAKGEGAFGSAELLDSLRSDVEGSG